MRKHKQLHRPLWSAWMRDDRNHICQLTLPLTRTSAGIPTEEAVLAAIVYRVIKNNPLTNLK